MQQQVQALLRALLAEQERERQLYQSLLAAISVTASARQRMLEDIVLATKEALQAEEQPKEAPARIAHDQLTEAIKRMSEARNRAFHDYSVN